MTIQTIVTTETLKPCKICLKPKPLSEFYKHGRTRDRKEHYCKQCKSEMSLSVREVRKTIGQCHCGNVPAAGKKTCATCLKRCSDWRIGNRAYACQKARDNRQAIKAEVFAHYGNRCACCDERRQEFLTIDHIKGGGNKHRKKLNKFGGASFYLWLKKQGYPSGYRLLCANCNFSRGHFGYCPHEEERKQRLAQLDIPAAHTLPTETIDSNIGVTNA